MKTPHRGLLVASVVAPVIVPLLIVLGLVAGAGAASADVPDGWSDPPAVSGLDMLWILLGAPMLVYLTVAVLAYLPGVVKGERNAEKRDTWFRKPPG
ncbi:MAG: hypothetical protein ACRCYQ_05040 [Nocardioides sp.]